MNGIHHYIYTNAHEKEHNDLLRREIDIPGRPRQVNPNVNPDDPNADPADDPQGDWDEDGLSNDWEETHHLNPRNSDTSGFFSGEGIGDSELYAYIAGWRALATRKALWRSDWATNGIQWGNWGPINLETNPTYDGNDGYHPWNFFGPSPSSPFYRNHNDPIGVLENLP